MKNLRLLVFGFIAFVTTGIHGQQFLSLGLGIEKTKPTNGLYLPQMHVEGNSLYVCTNQGLFVKVLSDKKSTWQLVGFSGIPLQNYARKGNDILALSNTSDEGKLLLSHDGGITYNDLTPNILIEHSKSSNDLIRLTQHPSDPSTLLISSYSMGLLQSTDFGQTWNQLTDGIVGTFAGYHPTKPEITYNSGMNLAYIPCLNISYDNGQTWDISLPDWTGDNCIYNVAFHPINPDRWIAGGQSVVYTTSDCGKTWHTQSFIHDALHKAIWNFTAYDNENADTIYMVGYSDFIKIMCSTDGGKTWNAPWSESIQGKVNDLQQYSDKLLIYTDTDIYEVSKTELISRNATTIRNTITTTTDTPAEFYDLQGRPMSGKQRRGLYIRVGRVRVAE